jgi:hypothetical protein
MYDFLSEYEYAEVAQGQIVQVGLTIRRDRDSISRRSPPPVKVDDFDVTERGAPGNPWPGFGQPAGLGR